MTTQPTRELTDIESTYFEDATVHPIGEDGHPLSANTVTFTHHIHAQLRRSLASDRDVIEAMLVSTQGAELLAYMEKEGITGIEGRINFLMKNRHGSPFEHNFFNFFMDCPIFVYREHHRHRIGISYNEESGRYTQLRPKFYIPHPDRTLVQVGKPGHYTFQPGSQGQWRRMANRKRKAARLGYELYLEDIADDIALEVARQHLGVNIFSAQVVSLNARSMMAFLSLRQAMEDEWAVKPLFESKPMAEINFVANVYEAALREHMPITWAAFCRNGRVAP